MTGDEREQESTCRCSLLCMLADEMDKRRKAETDLAAERERGQALYRAFVRHRTVTHEVKPMSCVTCRESDEALAALAASSTDKEANDDRD